LDKGNLPEYNTNHQNTRGERREREDSLAGRANVYRAPNAALFLKLKMTCFDI